MRTCHLLSSLLVALAAASSVNAQVFTYTGSIQTYVIPATGTYAISVSGAQGNAGFYYYQTVGGLGASVSGDVFLAQGTVLDIVVGQGGVNYSAGGGGGGGSFVYVPGRHNHSPLRAAAAVARLTTVTEVLDRAGRPVKRGSTPSSTRTAGLLASTASAAVAEHTTRMRRMATTAAAAGAGWEMAAQVRIPSPVAAAMAQLFSQGAMAGAAAIPLTRAATAAAAATRAEVVGPDPSMELMMAEAAEAADRTSMVRSPIRWRLRATIPATERCRLRRSYPSPARSPSSVASAARHF